MHKKEHLFNYLLRIGDDSLVLGHRLSEWCSRAPFLEEDLALTNISLDMTGQAQAFLAYAASVEGKGNTEDDLAYRRPEQLYFNHLLAELPNKDFAFTITRQLFFSAWQQLFFESLTRSADATIAAISSKAVKEARYHFEHAADWAVRLGDGTAESRERMQKAVNQLWQYTGELFEMDDTEKVLLNDNIAADLAPLASQWKQSIAEVLKEATLEIPADTYMQTGGRTGKHSENLGHLLCELQYLHRAYPDAKW